MTVGEDENKFKKESLQKISSIRVAVNNIEDFLNQAKLRKLLRSITLFSGLMRKLRNQSVPPFDLISTVCTHTKRIEDELGELESMIENRKTTLDTLLEQSNIGIETIQIIWKARVNKKHIILFLAPFYNQTRLKDGYYRRIKAVDDILGDDCLKVYVTPTNYFLEEEFHESFPDTAHIDLRFDFENPEHAKLLELIAIMSDLVYYHSVAFVNTITLSVDKLQILDLHGCVPEELAFLGYPEQAKLDGEKENAALENVDYVVVVSQAMARHLQEKYPLANVRYILLPILDTQIAQIDQNQKPKPYKDGKPEVVYVGGLQKWQMIPRMQSLINKTKHRYNYKILVPSPKEFLNYWKESETSSFCVCSGDREVVKDLCEKAHYGLLLREDNIVNRVSSPTKLVEYLAYGVVPVLISTAIGDFSDLGMKHISLADLESGNLPTEEERLRLVKENYECLDKLVKQYTAGKSDLLEALSQ